MVIIFEFNLTAFHAVLIDLIEVLKIAIFNILSTIIQEKL